ncbi:hypothetical protein EDB19DRAFT_1705412, partial [Suillus lakei]
MHGTVSMIRAGGRNCKVDHRAPGKTISDGVFHGPNHTVRRLERELAALRAKASLVDSERGRFKEEKKWVESQENIVRVSHVY